MRRHRFLFRSHMIAGLIAISLGACADPTEVPPLPELPEQLRLVATADGVQGEMNISCLVDLVLIVEPRRTHYVGLGGGEAKRYVLDATGAGIGFWADAAYRVRIEHGAGGAFAITSIDEDGDESPPVGDSRFWEEVRNWRGEVGEDDVLATGAWTCAPMDAHDDTDGSVTGTWTLRENGPAPAQ